MSKKRHKARELALQGLYQWQVTGQNVGEVINQLLTTNEARRFDVPLFQDLMHGVPAHLDELDGQLGPFLDRPVEQLDLVERAVLRLGAYELQHHLEVPYRVVINEAVELAKTYGADQGHRYVNGVLDKLARGLRPLERRA
jgi:N utilization substance protein B